MAQYAIAPQKGFADVLNEAADANERGIESDRRSALTVSQLQSEQARRRFAENADARAQEEAGRQRSRFDWEQEDRKRSDEMIKSFQDSANRHLFKDVPDETKAAIPFAGQPGEVAQPAPMKRVPIDLSTPEGLRAIASFQQEVFGARVRAGKVDQNEFNQLLTFSNMLEQRGNRDMFRKALSGDPEATAQIAKLANLDPSGLQIRGGVNKDGFPDLFAVTTRTENGKVVNAQVPIGHLAAIYAPEIYEATVSKPLGAAKDKAAIKHYQDTGSAALTNASANQADAQTRAKVGDSTISLNKARANALSDGTDPVNTASHKTSLYSSFTDAEGKNIVLPSASTNKARIAGQAEALGMNRRQAQRFADEEWARITANRSAIIAQIRAKKETEGGKPIPNTVRNNVQLEDEGLTSFTGAFLNSQGEEGLEARARLYMSRRASAMKDDKE